MIDPDAPPPLDLQARWRLLAGAVAAAVVLAAYPGWVWVQGLDRRRAEALVAPTHPTTAAELDELIELADAPDPAARRTALEAAARHGDPRIEPIALRRLGGTDPEEIANGLTALALAGRHAQRPRLVAFRRHAHPLLRQAADNGIERLDRAMVAALPADRPLTAEEVARIADPCGGLFHDESRAFRALEADAGRSADRRRVVLDLLDKLAAAGRGGQQGRAFETAARLRETPP